jgi:hypothetical protein
LFGSTEERKAREEIFKYCVWFNSVKGRISMEGKCEITFFTLNIFYAFKILDSRHIRVVILNHILEIKI